MAKRESSPGISRAKKKQIRYRSGSNFNAEYTRTFDWVMASDLGKQEAYCKVCSKHFSVSHGGIDDVRRHGGRQKAFRTVQRILKKNHGFSARCPAFFFRNLTCLCLGTSKGSTSSGSGFKASQKTGHGLKSHPTDWYEPGIKPVTPGYKT